MHALTALSKKGKEHPEKPATSEWNKKRDFNTRPENLEAHDVPAILRTNGRSVVISETQLIGEIRQF